MKRKYLYSLLNVGLATTLSTSMALAQAYEPFNVTAGFNHDVIANGATTAALSTTAAVDNAANPGAGFAYLSMDFMPPTATAPLTYGLPVNGMIHSSLAATLGVPFQLAPYTGNNVLRLQSNTDNGTLVFSNPASAQSILLSATSGSGTSTISVTFNFTDNTTETVTGVSVADWYNAANFIISGIGRVDRTTDALEPNATNPRIYQVNINIPAASHSKTLQSISITKTAGSGITNVFGATANLVTTCDAPTAVTSSGVTASAANISWTAATGASSYEYAYSTTPAMPNYSTTGTVATGTSFPLSGLTANTTYYVWARSVCSPTNKSGWTSTSSFTTLCGAVNGFTENFDALSTGSIVPPCWARIISGSGSQTISATTPASGTRNIYQYSSNTNNSTIVVLPELSNVNAGTHWLRFKARVSSGSGTLNVGYVTNITDATTFVNIETITISNTSYTVAAAQREIIIPATIPANARLAIRNPGSTTASHYWDDVEWVPVPSCLTPGNATASNITPFAATLEWTAPSFAPANGYEYYYSATNTAPTASTTPSGNTAAGIVTANISSLTANTTYFVWVRSVCGTTNKSNWTSSSTFTTLCSSTAVPYFLDFENTTGSALPVCTQNQNLGAGNNWITSSGAVGQFTGRFLRYTWNSANAANTWFYTQGIQLTAGTNYELKYEYGANSTTTYTERLKVAYGTSADATAMTTELANDTIVFANPAPKDEKSIIFTPTTTGVYYFGFHAYSAANQNSLVVDNISVDVAPTCFVPTALASNNITASGATLSWVAPTPTAPSNGYEYYLSTSNTAPTATTAATGTTGAGVTTANPSGLTANTLYYAWVRSVCSSSDKSHWISNPITFTTACAGVTTLFENFDSYVTGVNLPDCWYSLIVGSGSMTITSTTPASGTRNMYQFVTAAANPVYAVLPPLSNINAGTHQLRFKARSTSTAGTLNVGYLTDHTDASTWVNIQTLTINNTTYTAPGSEYSVIIPNTVPAGARLAIANLGVNSASYYWDDVYWEVVPTCIPPTALTATGVTANGVTLGWTPPTTTVGIGYDYYINASNTAPTATTTPSGSAAATATSVTASTLNPATNYHFWMRSNCAASDQSSWTYGGMFTTPCVVFSAPFLEEFSGGALPNCWTNTNNPAATGATLLWKFSGAVDYGTTNNGRTAGSYAWVDASTPYTSDVILTSPQIDLSTVAGPIVEFQWFKFHSASATNGVIVNNYDNNELIVEINDGTGWTEIFADTSNAQHWRTESITLPASYANATVQLRFIVDKDIASDPYFYDNVLLDSIAVIASPCTPPVVALGVDTSFCQGASLTLDAGAGLGLTYVWNTAATTPTIDVTATGIYHVTVDNGNCSSSDTIVVSVLPAPVVDLGNDTTDCVNGGPITLTAGTSGSNTYLWNNNTTGSTLSATTSGTYWVVVTNAAGCVSTDTIELVVGQVPSVGGITATGPSPNFSFTAETPTNVDTYTWNFGDNSPESDLQNPTHIYTPGTADQTYTVRLIVSNECGSDTVETSVIVRSNSLKGLNLNADALKLYPNPTAQMVTLENTSSYKMKQVIITNILGQQVAVVPVNGNKQTIDVSNLTSGLYHVKVEFEEGVVTRKLEVLK